MERMERCQKRTGLTGNRRRGEEKEDQQRLRAPPHHFVVFVMYTLADVQRDRCKTIDSMLTVDTTDAGLDISILRTAQWTSPGLTCVSYQIRQWIPFDYWLPRSSIQRSRMYHFHAANYDYLLLLLPTCTVLRLPEHP